MLYDRLIADGKAKPAIVVMCNGMYYKEDESGITLEIGKVLELLRKEVIPFVDCNYRTIPDKAHRGMAGLSMGSLQTSILSFMHPELFDYIGVFSGFVQDLLTGSADHVTEEKLTAFAGEQKLFFRAMGTRIFILNILKRMTGCWSAIKYRASVKYIMGSMNGKSGGSVSAILCR